MGYLTFTITTQHVIPVSFTRGRCCWPINVVIVDWDHCCRHALSISIVYVHGDRSSLLNASHLAPCSVGRHRHSHYFPRVNGVVGAPPGGRRLILGVACPNSDPGGPCGVVSCWFTLSEKVPRQCIIGEVLASIVLPNRRSRSHNRGVWDHHGVVCRGVMRDAGYRRGGAGYPSDGGGTGHLPGRMGAVDGAHWGVVVTHRRHHRGGSTGAPGLRDRDLLVHPCRWHRGLWCHPFSCLDGPVAVVRFQPFHLGWQRVVGYHWPGPGHGGNHLHWHQVEPLSIHILHILLWLLNDPCCGNVLRLACPVHTYRLDALRNMLCRRPSWRRRHRVVRRRVRTTPVSSVRHWECHWTHSQHADAAVAASPVMPACCVTPHSLPAFRPLLPPHSNKVSQPWPPHLDQHHCWLPAQMTGKRIWLHLN